MDFYGIVLTVAAIVFLLLLTLLGVLISRSSTSTVFPPTMSTCPDYWEVDLSGNCQYPLSGSNQGHLGIVSDKALHDKPPFATFNNGTNKAQGWYFNPKDTKWTGIAGKTSVCSQRDWAVKYNIVWDGVSNYNAC